MLKQLLLALKRLLRALGPVLVGCIFLGAVYLLYREISKYSLADIRMSLAQISTGSIILSVLLAIINYIICPKTLNFNINCHFYNNLPHCSANASANPGNVLLLNFLLSSVDIFVLKESEYHLGNERPLDKTTLSPGSTIFVGTSGGRLCSQRHVFFEAESPNQNG